MPRRGEEPTPEPTAEPTPTEGEEPVRYDMPNFEAVRWDEGAADWEGGAAPDPQIVMLNPDTGVVDAAVAVFVNGQNFDPDAVVEVDGTAVATTPGGGALAGLQLRADLTLPAAAGTLTFTVRNVGSGLESNDSPFTVTAVE